MTNWMVKLFNREKTLDYKRIVVNSECIETAFELAEAAVPGYSAVSAHFHSTDYGISHGSHDA